MPISEFAWLVEYDRKLCEKQRGKWIAIWNDEEIGVGDTATQVADQADIRRREGDYLLQAYDLQTDVIHGGVDRV